MGSPGSGILNFSPNQRRDRCCLNLRNELCGSRRLSRCRKHRPNSSPAHSRMPDELVSLMYHSPSVSPDRGLQSGPTPATSPLTTKCFGNEDTDQRIYAFGKGSEAYFSPRPPIEPMHIILVGVSPQHKMLFGQSSPLSQEDVFSVSTPSGGDAYNVVPPIFLADPTRSLETYPSELPATSCSNSPNFSVIGKRHQSPNKVRDMVQLLLFEFVTNLPLPVLAAGTNTAATATFAISRETIAYRLHRKCSSQSRCSIAVQALAHEKSVSKLCHDSEPQPAAEEWVGGVRALRDSHVRLVLHQLRHIDRLNRALDHAFHRRARSSRSHHAKNRYD